jgi:putative ABC transport system substrate-binding protein
MRRRDFITLAGGAAAWPIAAYTQQGERMRRASVLMSYAESDASAQKWAKAFDDSLQQLGWNNGRNIQLDHRWAGPNPDRLRGDAEELMRLGPDVRRRTRWHSDYFTHL